MRLENRILEICYQNKISHIGSFISSVGIIDSIFEKKQKNDLFILSNGHSGLALYVVLEKFFGLDAVGLYKKHGLHPHRDIGDKIYCSTGSLGAGICIAVGAALAKRDRDVYCLISDGEAYEGSVFEALVCAKENNLTNLKVYVSANGFAAYKTVDLDQLERRLTACFPVNFVRTDFGGISFLNGLAAHYHVISDSEAKQIGLIK